MSILGASTHHAERLTSAAFDRVHLAVFVACWIPLNPIVVEAVRNPRFALDGSSLFGILASIFGPFTPRLFDSRAALHPELILVAATILSLALFVQFAWRPTATGGAVLRQLIWAAGCWLWFASAFVAFVANI